MKTSNCPSHYDWDRFHADSLSAEQREAIALHMATCDLCQAREQEREASRMHLRQLSQWQELIAEGQRRSVQLPTQSTPMWLQWWQQWQAWFWGGGCVALAVAAYLFLPAQVLQQILPAKPLQTLPVVTPTGRKGARPKSTQPSLRMMHYRQGSRHSLWTKDGERLHPGDFIQFSYQSVRPFHLLIASINQRGVFSTFVPLGGRRSTHITAKHGDIPKRGSLELDDYIGAERIFIVTSHQSFAASQFKRAVQQALAKAGSLARLTNVPGAWFVKTYLIHKRKRLIP